MKETKIINYIVTEEGNVKVEGLDAENTRKFLLALRCEDIKTETVKQRAGEHGRRSDNGGII